MKFLALMFLMLSMGCANMFGGRLSEADMQTQAQKASDEAEIKNFESMLAQGHFDQALKAFQDFQSRRPQSQFFQAARLGEAQALEGQGRFQEAADLDRDIYLKTLQHQPEIAAMALYRASYAYEALGDDLRTVTTLLDARKLAEHLPIEIASAEIPARLASVYGRQGREDEAISYLNEAEKGIMQVIAEKGPQLQKDWLAKTYMQMGGVSTNQLSSENFQDLIQGQKWVQVYLIKAMRQNDPIWSLKARDKIARNLSQFVHTA